MHCRQNRQIIGGSFDKGKEVEMGNEQKTGKPNKYIMLTLIILLALVCVVAIVVIISMTTTADKTTETQAAAPTLVNTPSPEVTEEYTLIPIVTVPIVTAEPTPTEFATAVITFEEDTVWINLSHLVIRPQPDFSYDKIGNIPYGTKVMGEIDGLWMYTSYDGVQGYIYVGKIKDTDRPCVVYSPSDLQPLE